MRALSIHVLCFISLLLGASSAAFSQDRDVRKLACLMTGSWNSFRQAEADEAAKTEYRHTRALIRVLPVAIPELKKGIALYVENLLAEKPAQPYRQRVYFFSRIDGKINLRIYRISRPEEVANAYQNPDLLKKLSFDRLTREEGCDLVYERTGAAFKGRIIDAKACQSTLRGAAYTYSESEISKDEWINLDQGFDAAGNHKWGPPPGTVGHIFRREDPSTVKCPR